MIQRLVQAMLLKLESVALVVVILLAAWQLFAEPEVMPLWWSMGWLVAWGAVAAWSLFSQTVPARHRPRVLQANSWLVFGLSLAMVLSVRPQLFEDSPPIGWSPIAFTFVPLGAAFLGVVVRPPAALLGACGLIGAQWWVWQRLLSGSYHLGARLGLVAALGVATSLAVDRMRSAADAAALAEEESASARKAAAACCAEAIEGARWDSLVHDEVLATLELTARGDLQTERLRDRAAYTQRLIERRARPTRSDDAELLARLRTLADASGARLIAHTTPNEPLPGQVVEALVAATQEALRNALLHGRPDEIRVDYARVAGCVEIAIVDDGSGFRTDTVDPARMGLRVSVHGQVEAVGGRVEVLSAPGAGTRVTLHWGPGGPGA